MYLLWFLTLKMYLLVTLIQINHTFFFRKRVWFLLFTGKIFSGSLNTVIKTNIKHIMQKKITIYTGEGLTVYIFYVY